MKNKNIQSNTWFTPSDLALSLILSFMVIVAFGSTDAYAGVTTVGTAICEIPRSVILGNIGRGIATLGIVVLGVMATLGRITWTQAIVVGVGISVIFGAAAVASMLAANQGIGCTGL